MARLTGSRKGSIPKRWQAHDLGDSSRGPVILVTVRPPDGPDDMIVVQAYSEAEAIEYVKAWLVSIDYDPKFRGIHFRADWPDVDSVTLIEPLGE
jgi:hypothetical protein